MDSRTQPPWTKLLGQNPPVNTPLDKTPRKTKSPRGQNVPTKIPYQPPPPSKPPTKTPPNKNPPLTKPPHQNPPAKTLPPKPFR